MTSKTSSSKPLLYTFWSGLKGPALAPAIVNSLVFILFTLLEPLTNYAKDISYTNEAGELVVIKATEMYKYFVLSASDLTSVLLLICVIATSIAAAVFSFNFITSKKTVNVYYSLGISRDKLYFGKYVSGAALMVLSIAIPFLLALVSNIIFLGYSKTLLMVTLFYILSFCATSLIVFSITAATFSSVGTFFEATIFSTIILAFPTVILMSFETFMSNFVHGTPYGNVFHYANLPSYSFYGATSEKLIWKLDFLNPLFFDYKTLSKWGAMDPSGANNTLAIFRGNTEQLSWYPSILKAICWILVSVAIMFIGTYLFQKRKAEICGFIGTNKVLNTFATFTVGFFFLSAAISVTFNNISLLLTLVIAFIIFAVIYIGLELLLLRDFKKFLRGLFKLPIELAVTGAIIAVFITGLFGFSSKLPDASEIVKVAVTPIGISNEYGFSQNVGYPVLSNMTEDFSYSTSTGLVDGFTSQKDIKLISGLHEKLIKLGRVKPLEYFDEAYATTPEDERVLKTAFQFVYTLKNGKTLMRSYNAATPDIIKSFLDIEKTDLFSQRLNKVFNEKLSAEKLNITLEKANDSDLLEYAKQIVRNENNNISITTQNGISTLNLTFTMAEKAELARCIYMDLSKRTIEEKYFPKENPLGVINFTYKEYFKSNEDFYIDGSFTNPHMDDETTTDESTTDESTTDESGAAASDTTLSTGNTQKQPLKISLLSASPISDEQTSTSSEVTTTEQIESTTNTENSIPVPETEIDEEQEAEAEGIILDNAIKIEKQSSVYVIGRGPAENSPLQIVLTSDMENTIRFLKIKGLYDELLDKSTYTSAQVISVPRFNRHNAYSSYYKYDSTDRLFSGSYFAEQKSSKGQGPYYFHSQFDYSNNFTALSANEITELYKASRFVYYNNFETGYYVKFATSDKTEKVTMFIPNALITTGMKNKISQFESSNEYYKSNGNVYY